MLRSKICLFCMKRAQKCIEKANKMYDTDKKKSAKLIDRSFWWIKRSIDFAGKEEIRILKEVWPSEEEIRAM